MYFKRISILCCLVIVLILSSCNGSEDRSIITTNGNVEPVTTTALATEAIAAIPTTDGNIKHVTTTAPVVEEVTVIPSERALYTVIENSSALEEHYQYISLDWSKVADFVEGEHYEAYNGLYDAPISATLYKNGNVVSIGLNDTRLMKLLNFYHNSAYNHKCSVLQGRFGLQPYIEFITSPFRLELLFEQKSYEDNSILSFEKVIVTGYSFVCIDSDTIINGIPFAIGEFPYGVSGTVNWLEVFGF